MGGHAEYVHHTSVWLAWLAQTAKDHGIDIQTDGDFDAVAARSGRLKGKERKRARKAGLPMNIRSASEMAAMSGVAMSEAATTTKLLTTEEIFKTGHSLADIEGLTLIMPQKVWRSYKQALAMRERYAKWYDSDPTSDPRDNAGHRYFNSVMRDVH
jgi:hypothetical protein